jgi:hypothetical protein
MNRDLFVKIEDLNIRVDELKEQCKFIEIALYMYAFSILLSVIYLYLYTRRLNILSREVIHQINMRRAMLSQLEKKR